MSLDPSALLFAVVVIAARMLPVVELVPVFSGPWVPRTVRFAIVLALTGLVAPVALPPAMLASPPGLVEAIAIVVRELLVGLALGFLSSLMFEAARMTGAVVDRLASTSGETDGPVTRLYLIIAVVLFFGVGGAQLWLYALAQSYIVLPLDAGFGSFDGLTVARLVADAIGLAVVLAMPVLGAVLAAELSLAVAGRMSKTMSQAIPCSTRTLVAVIAVALSLGIFADELGGHVVQSLRELPPAVEDVYVQ